MAFSNSPRKRYNFNNNLSYILKINSKKEIILKFIEYCTNDESKKLASNCGFNAIDYTYSGHDFIGTEIIDAQNMWKKQKNGSNDLTAVFVSDVSGSMEGSPLLKLKASLNRAASFIDENTNIYVNPTGRFVIGGPLGDTGLTGRKIIVDTYGGYARHGGGAFSGKDATKVDRSSAYMLRHIAKNIVANGYAKKCELQVSYAIGMKEPISIYINTFGTSQYTDEELVSSINSKENDKLEYLGAIIYGNTEEVDKITGKFQLWRID